MSSHVTTTTALGECNGDRSETTQLSISTAASSVFARTSELPYSKRAQVDDLAIDQNGVELWFEFRKSQTLPD